ncbi:cocaine- and amphetamine-regulated transcript protein [Scleropages formosus]|uniref:CART prepropeptide n=1 Tax=Scleropages formosus TaxID=113540 RepID=A0A8C9S8A7_SCLFO|nr:cocaine- and amphetamine-regulated transcript protein-like [Scleropages formosus]
MSARGIKRCHVLDSQCPASGLRSPSSTRTSPSPSTSPSTMASGRLVLLSVSCSVLFLLGACDESLETRSPENPVKTQEEKELIEALQEVLEKLKNKQMPSAEKKLGWVPSCDAGEQCAIRKGARIGKLCNCPRGTSCNFSILKCL